MKAFINWIKSIFTKERVGTIISIIANAHKSATASYIKNPEIQQEAFDIVKSLASQDLTATEKRVAFNRQMSEFMSKYVKTISSSTINALRELALSAYKISSEEDSTEK